MTLRVLFCLKFRANPYEDGDGEACWGQSGEFLSSGLYNSARMVCEMLDDAGVDVKLVHVVDNNQIHKEVVAFRPDIVIIEAFWVVPEKFDELKHACPGVLFIVRNHSETSFLASDGIAFGWILDYATRSNVAISCNAPRILRETRALIDSVGAVSDVEAKTPYLPNYYQLPLIPPVRPLKDKAWIDVGCFGAIRPLKNHVSQALAAIMFADRAGKPLRLHINASRVETGGDPILKNLREVFRRHPRHELIEHAWMDHTAFRRLLSTMCLVSAVSYSETFCIVAADAVSLGVATVTSSEIAWSSAAYQADPSNVPDIAAALERAYRVKLIEPGHNPSLAGLIDYNRMSRDIWLDYLQNPREK